MSGGEWFRRWFGRDYLALYPHRDRAEARRVVELLLAHVRVREEGHVLDLACGAGRHLAELRKQGLRASGLDLSELLLHRARSIDPPLRVVRGDMRHLPFRPTTFDLVTSFFTSFGYFEREEEDRRVLREVRAVLRPGGRFFLDFLNATQVARTLEPREVRRLDGRRVVQERRLVDDGRFVEKRIRIEGEEDPSGAGVEVSSYLERVRLYRPDELEELLSGAGLTADARFGDYQGGSLRSSSPRCILLGTAV